MGGSIVSALGRGADGIFSGPRAPSGQSAKQGNAMEDMSGEVHWETHDTRIDLCKYAGIVLCRIS